MLIRIVASFSLAACLAISVGAQNSSAPANLAAVAKASASGVSDDTSLAALNDGYAPRNSRDNRHGSYGNWPDTGTQWVEYDWSQPVSTKQIEVYWWDDHQGVRLPQACRLKFWNGKILSKSPMPAGLAWRAINSM
jgi:hypothetical protein